ncbi:lipocalin family protein [Prevotella sp. oral taxon 820]|uniref:lipocalin family protein n=1 Tax=Prevotella sp. oral taxon 820 TaxID=2081962 RepID=UPI001E53E27F|nr:lipocalin family protein [Prevotella sp. oral taxon 820]
MEEQRLKGDSTVYGIACEGCNDSVVILLPTDGSDPIRYNCYEASQNNKIIGKPAIGDRIGVMINKHDKKKVDLVINIDELKGIWCYVVMPKMRDWEHMSKSLQRRIERNMPDSVKATYMIPREYGFWMKRNWECQSVGYVSEASSLEAESPVVYPQLGYFTEWRIWNGKLIVTNGTPNLSKTDNKLTITNLQYDTCNIDYLGPDSLVLSDSWGTRSYYRKNDINDVNVKAKQIAAELKTKAFRQTTKE